MYDLVFQTVVGLSLYATLSAAKARFWEMRKWFSLDRERLFKACIVFVPALTIAIGFQVLISGGPLRIVGLLGLTPLYLVVTCFLAPILEEWTRAMVLVFCQECGSVIVGLLIGSLSFALLHSLSIDLVYARAFFFALLSGLLTLWTKGIGPSILVHILTNIVLVSLAAS